ncbi:MAG: helix-turn-helix domain-containing protein [Flavobacteriaceae bacterium]|tara:strand:- start:2330 stop:2734 length:405 start_codon:yes stop_codon:yes gene_type:complete
MSIVNRIKQLMHDSELSAAAFSDIIGVQRSSISHILSERNKPSLDFILKILHAYPSVSSEWLLKGIDSKSPPTFGIIQDKKAATPRETEITDTNPETKSTPQANTIHRETSNKVVEHIIVCYKDGTSITYLNKN